MESKKHIISSGDRKEVRNRIWEMLHDGTSKNDIYKELVKDYQSEYELASLIAATPNFNELPEFQKKNKALFILLCIVCADKVIGVFMNLLWYILDKDIENKGILSFIMIPLLCLALIIPVWLTFEVKRMNGRMYFWISILCIMGVGQLFREYPETGLGWIITLAYFCIIVSIGILSYRIHKKHFSHSMSIERDEDNNYIFG